MQALLDRFPRAATRRGHAMVGTLREASVGAPGRFTGMARGGALVGLVCMAALLAVARAVASDGTIHTMVGHGVRMEADSRWTDGGGYRPFRFRFAPIGVVQADRTLQVELNGQGAQWYRSGSVSRVVCHVELPAGSSAAAPIETVLPMPDFGRLSAYQINVYEDGRLIKALSTSWESLGGGIREIHELMPTVLFVASTPPDTAALGRLFPLDQYLGYAYTTSVVSPDALPTSHVATPDELPSRWIDYSSLDIVCLSMDQLELLRRKRTAVWEAIVGWAAAGGNLWVFGAGDGWEHLGRLERLLELPPGEDAGDGSPEQRGWRRPDANLRGRPFRGRDPEASIAGEPNGAVPGIEDSMRHIVSLADEPKEAPARPPAEFLLRPLGFGLVVAMADAAPFPPLAAMPPGSSGLPGAALLAPGGGGTSPSAVPAPAGGAGSAGAADGAASSRGAHWSSADWAWLLESIGEDRYLWYQRHGLSHGHDNRDFWKFLVPGVGLVPVVEFCAAITLFALIVGPVNYFLLRRRRRVDLLVVTIPLSAGAVTALMFGYALIVDGLSVRVRARSMSEIDQRTGRTVCWARLSYYAGLAPSGGLVFPSDTAVFPLEPFADEYHRGSAAREVVWDDAQRLRSGWLPSRAPMQLVTVRSRRSELGLDIRASGSRAAASASSSAASARNRLGARIEQLAVALDDGSTHWAEGIEPGAEGELKPMAPGEARRRLAAILRAEPFRLDLPEGMNPDEDFAAWSLGRPYTLYSRAQWYFAQFGVPRPTQQTSRLERELGRVGAWNAGEAAGLEPRSYVAILSDWPEASVGLKSVRREPSLHVVRGRW